MAGPHHFDGGKEGGTVGSHDESQVWEELRFASQGVLGERKTPERCHPFKGALRMGVSHFPVWATVANGRSY